MRIWIFMPVLILHSCVYVFDSNEFEKLIPARSLVDTCSNEHYINHIVESKGDFLIQLENDKLVANGASILWMDLNDSVKWEYMAGNPRYISISNDEEIIFHEAISNRVIRLSNKGDIIVTFDNPTLERSKITSPSTFALFDKNCNTECFELRNNSGQLIPIDFPNYTGSYSVLDVLEGESDLFYVVTQFSCESTAKKCYELICFEINGSRKWSQRFLANTAKEYNQVKAMFIDQRVNILMTTSFGADPLWVQSSLDGASITESSDMFESDLNIAHLNNPSNPGTICGSKTIDNGTASYILKLDSTYNNVWSKTIGKSNADARFSLAYIQKDGSILCTGTTNGYDGISKRPVFLGLTVRYDENGNTCY
ncbi:hypothetical protein N8Z47_04040 [Salibacteraceae bacterium]|jgi:hypothetical protein|nr:hypothetical protein [Salibacteraceae bacterium]